MRIASSGKGVGRIGRDEINLRSRQANLLRQALDDVINARQIVARNGLRTIGGKRDLVGEKVRDEIQDGGEDKRHQHAVLAAQSASDEHEQHGHDGEKECGFEDVTHMCLRFDWSFYWMLWVLTRLKCSESAWTPLLRVFENQRLSAQ